MDLLTYGESVRINRLAAQADKFTWEQPHRQGDVYSPKHFGNLGDFRRMQRRHLRVVNADKELECILYEQLRYRYQVTWDMS